MKMGVDVTGKTTAEIRELLGKSDKPTLCLVPWDKTNFLQSRVETNPELVAEYQEVLGNGKEMPAAKGIFDEHGRVQVVDGIHTTQARRNLGSETIPVLLRRGTLVEAEIEASRANATHGAKRTSADKRNAVKRLLRNPQLCARSNNWLADTAMVSPQLVESVREEMEVDADHPILRPAKRRVMRNGATWLIDAPRKQKRETAPKPQPGDDSPESTAERITQSMCARLQKLPESVRTPVCRTLVATIQATYLITAKDES